MPADLRATGRDGVADPRNPGIRKPLPASSRTEAVETANPVLDPQAALEAANRVQQALERVDKQPHEVVFRHDEVTNGFVVEIRNPDGSVIRQYPPEKLLNLRRNLDELSGMVIDEMT
jgi:uncharacterized FlaG/YvyC family protein